MQARVRDPQEEPEIDHEQGRLHRGEARSSGRDAAQAQAPVSLPQPPRDEPVQREQGERHGRGSRLRRRAHAVFGDTAERVLRVRHVARHQSRKPCRAVPDAESRVQGGEGACAVESEWICDDATTRRRQRGQLASS